MSVRARKRAADVWGGHERRRQGAQRAGAQYVPRKPLLRTTASGMAAAQYAYATANVDTQTRLRSSSRMRVWTPLTPSRRSWEGVLSAEQIASRSVSQAVSECCARCTFATARSGSFAVVKRGIRKADGKNYAIKCVACGRMCRS